MAKKDKNNVIALEIENFENKIKEFQIYLHTHDIRRIGEFEKEGGDKYKEVDLQIKMMNALPNWLVALKSLKEAAAELQEDLRGDSEMNDAAILIRRK